MRHTAPQVSDRISFRHTAIVPRVSRPYCTCPKQYEYQVLILTAVVHIAFQCRITAICTAVVVPLVHSVGTSAQPAGTSSGLSYFSGRLRLCVCYEYQSTRQAFDWYFRASDWSTQYCAAVLRRCVRLALLPKKTKERRPSFVWLFHFSLPTMWRNMSEGNIVIAVRREIRGEIRI